MSIGQYANYTQDQKLTILLTKMDNVENRLESLEKKYDDKPCPSESCLTCQATNQELKRDVKRIEKSQEEDHKTIESLVKFKEKVETTSQVEECVEEDHKTREAWVIPMWAMIVLTVLTFVKDFFF